MTLQALEQRSSGVALGFLGADHFAHAVDFGFELRNAATARPPSRSHTNCWLLLLPLLLLVLLMRM